MKGFNNTTKTIAGHHFPKSSVSIRPHVRMMPVKKVTPTMPTAQGALTVVGPTTPMTPTMPDIGLKKGGWVDDPRSPMIKPKSGC